MGLALGGRAWGQGLGGWVEPGAWVWHEGSRRRTVESWGCEGGGSCMGCKVNESVTWQGARNVTGSRGLRYRYRHDSHGLLASRAS